MALVRGSLSKHGFPRGFRYTPKHEELIDILADRIRDRPMAPQVHRVFNNIRILEFHPQELYEKYRACAEAGCIYFFSQRESASGTTTKKGASAAAEGKKWRPTRTVHGGGWKPSGGAKDVRRPESAGGAVIGRMVTMVFYDRRREGGEDKQFKTNWGMHEFTVLMGPEKYSKLAVYRLYKVKNGGANKGRNQQQQAIAPPPVHRAADVAVPQQHPSTSSSSCSAGTSASAQAFAAASTSTAQEQKPLVISTGQIQRYHNQYAFGLPPQHGVSIPPPAAAFPQMPDYFKFAAQSEQGTATIPAPVHVDGAPAYFQFAARSSEQGTTPPAVMMNPGEQQPPAKPVSADQFGATKSSAMSPPNAPFSGGDEKMEEAASQLEVVPPPPQLVLPPVDCCDMDAMLSHLSGVPVEFHMYDDLDAGDIWFTMQELGGTDNYTPGGDVINQADGMQEPPPAAF